MKKENRLLKNEDFKNVISKRNNCSNSSFNVCFLKTTNNLRIGISVSKKIGNAVIRNKIKRQIRMMCQSIFPITLSYDIVIICQNSYLTHNYQENYKNLEYIYSKILKENK